MRHADDFGRLKRQVRDGTYDESKALPTVVDRVHAKLAKWFGWRTGENHDDKPLVHIGYTHELDDAGHIDFGLPPAGPSPRRGGPVSSETRP